MSLSAADPPAADPPPPTSTTAATAEKFASWLATRRVSARTRATCAERAGRFLGWLDDDAASVEGDPLADSDAFTAAARDRRACLLTVAKAPPATVNVSLAALVALAECLGARGAGRGSGRPAGARSRRPGRIRGPPAAARRPSDRLDPGPGAARAVLSGPGLRLAEAAAHRRRRAHHRAHRAAAGRRPQPAAVLAHRACPAPGRPAGRARPVAGPPGPPVRPAAAAHRRRAGRRRPAGGLQRAHPAVHRGDPLAARRRSTSWWSWSPVYLSHFPRHDSDGRIAHRPATPPEPITAWPKIN